MSLIAATPLDTPPPAFKPLELRRLAERFRSDLRQTQVFDREPLSRHTSFRIGGPADVLVMPWSVPDLQRVITLTREAGIPLTVIGNGSNLLIRDGGLRGVVLKVAENFGHMEFKGTHAYAQSGALLGVVSRHAALHHQAGLEFAVGIPGTIGGGVMMNAGAYGGEMCEVVTLVRVIDQQGQILELANPDMQFAYRRSILQSKDWVVLDMEMELRPDDVERILSRMSLNQFLRESKQPLSYPSAGSIFKRPPGKYVGPMIEQLGLKGHRIGGAQVSVKHAGFIVNAGGATAADVLALIQHIREQVQARFDVWLETEVRIIGEEAPPD